MKRILLYLAHLLLLVPSVPAQEADLAAWRVRMLAIAQRYATHAWIARDVNRFHGDDPDGVRVDTPDGGYSEGGWQAGDLENVGIPYQWGGFSTLEEFEQGLAEGKYAGHIPTALRSAGSEHAVGVDCSGFVSRCWDLSEKQSTRSIPSLCYEVDSWEALEVGDALNRFDSHVMLFTGWADEAHTRVRVFEAVNPCVREGEHPVAALQQAGYVPLRYRPLDTRWKADRVDVSHPAMTCAPGAAREWVATGEEQEIDPDALGTVLTGARPGAWARLRMSTRRDDSPVPEVEELTQGIARLPGEGSPLTVHVRKDPEGPASLDTLVQLAPTTPRLDAWIPLVLVAGVPERSREILSATAQEGTYRMDDTVLPARRVRMEVLLIFPGPGPDGIPVALSFDVVTSDVVPVHGLLGGDVRLEILAEPDAPTVVEVRVDLVARG
jgi:hypothetical protein